MFINKKTNLEKHIVYSHLKQKYNNLFLSHFQHFFFYTLFISPLLTLVVFHVNNPSLSFFETYPVFSFIFIFLYLTYGLLFLLDFLYYEGDFKAFRTQIKYGSCLQYNYKNFLKEKDNALKLLFSINISHSHIERFLLELETKSSFGNDTIEFLYNQLQNTNHYKNIETLELPKSKNVINNFLKENPSFNKNIDFEGSQPLVFFKKDEGN